MSVTPSTSLDSLSKMPNDGSALPKAANFLSQLEAMMGAVKKEAGALESMKAKLKEMEDLKAKYFESRSRMADLEVENSDLRRKLKDSEQLCGEIRNDMQRLNDIYNGDRMKYLELQQLHTKAEQDMNTLIHEKELFVKEMHRIPELKSAMKATKAQLHQLKATSEEERNKLQQKIAELDKKLSQNGDHVWRLTEELDKVKHELEVKAEENRKLVSQMTDASLSKNTHRIVQERQGMIIEDLFAQRQAMVANLIHWRKEFHMIEAENSNLVHKLSEKEERFKAAQEKLASLEASHVDKITSVTMTVGTLQDSVKELTGKNQLLTQEVFQLKQKLSSKYYDEEKNNTEIQKLKQALSDLENSLKGKEVEHMQSLRSVTLQRDDLAYKLQTITSQLESLQTQAKLEQTKHWEELSRLKDSEGQLLEELEKLNTEVQEKMAAIQVLETEKLTNENQMRNEASGSSTMIQTLRTELDKRLSELVHMREESQTLAATKESLAKQLEEAKGEIVRMDQLFKRTVEADRNKMKQELTARANRVKQLEAEKEELLNETHELMSQASEAQKQVIAHKGTAEELNRQSNQLLEQVSLLKTRVNELTSDLRQVRDVESGLRQDLATSEARYRDELVKHDLQLKEARKSSSQQVLDLTNQVKSMFEEMDDYKRQLDESYDKERRTAFDRDKLRTDLDHLQTKLTTSQDEASKEIYSLKREIIDLKNKAKLALEHKAKLEGDLLACNKEIHRLEADFVQQGDNVRLLESNLGASQDQIRAMKGTIDTIQENRSHLSHRLQELESVLTTKNQAIEHLNADLAQVERDGLVEIRRLRLTLNAAEAELNELRPAQALLAKELEDTKAGLSKAVANNNSTVTGILEDLKRAEDALSREKKARQGEGDDWRHRIKDAEMLAEKFRQELEDVQARIKSDKQDKDLKLVYLEKEVDRLKVVLREKDERVEDLEQQHHQNRRKALEMKESLDNATAEVAQVKSVLDMEQSHRKRLEARLRQLISSADMNKDFAPSSSASASSSLTSRARSAVGHRDKERSGGGTGGSLLDDADHSTLVSSAHTFGDDMSVLSGYSRGLPPASLAGGASRSDHTVSYYDQGQAVPGAGLLAASTVDLDDAASLPSGGGGGGGGSLYAKTRPGQSSQILSSPVKPTASSSSSSSSSSAAGGGGATAPSPAVDRVSATLALKLAQQQRNHATTTTPTTTSTAAAQSIPTGLDALRASQRPGSRPSTSSGPRPTAEGGQYDPYYDAHDDSAPSGQLATSLSGPNLRSLAGEASLRDLERVESNNAVEESIRRTQQALNRRLGQVEATANPLPSLAAELSPSATVGSTGSGRGGSGGGGSGGRSATKLMESIQQAHSLYPASPVAQRQRPVSTLDALDVDVTTPVLQPASPPRDHRPIQGAYDEDDDDDAEEDEADTQEAYPATTGASMDAALRFQLPGSGMHTQATHGAAAASGIATSKGKQGKKTKKKKKGAESAYSDVQLPRIGSKHK